MRVRTESVSAVGKAQGKGKGLLFREQNGPCDEREEVGRHERQVVFSARISILDFIPSATESLEKF